MAVDGKGWEATLGIGGHDGGEVHGTWALSAIEAPDSLHCVRVKVHGLEAVAPAGSDGEGRSDVVLLELGGAAGALGASGDCCIGNDDLDWLAVGIEDVLGDEVSSELGEAHRLVLEALADAVAAAIDGWADSNSKAGCHEKK